MLDGCWMVGESGIKANSAQLSWRLAELGNNTSIQIIDPIAIYINISAINSLKILSYLTKRFNLKIKTTVKP